MKKIIILFIFFYSNTMVGQRPTFSIGLTYQPTFYWSYTKSDWNNMPQSYPAGPNGFNGQAIGLEVEKKISKKFNLKVEMVLSTQEQKYIASSAGTSNSIRRIDIYNLRASTQFEYLKVPILLARYIKLKNYKNTFISGFIGPQMSLLLDYKFETTEYKIPFKSKFVYVALLDEVVGKSIYTPYEYNGTRVDRFDPSKIKTVYRSTDFRYNRYVLGIVSGLGLKKIFNKKFYMDISSRIEFDVTDSEPKDFREWAFIGGSGKKKSRGIAHNIRVGFSISVGYLFSVEKEKRKKTRK